VCFNANGEGTLKVSLQGGYAQLPSSLISVIMMLNYCFVLTMVVLALVML
jgi:hypothetical protein